MNTPLQEGPAAPGLISPRVAPSAVPDPSEPCLQLLRRYNHQCRNSLSAIKMGLYLCERESVLPPDRRWNELALLYEEVEWLFDRLQLLYRTCSLTWVRSPLGQLISERLPVWRSWLGARGRSIEIDLPLHDDPGDFDPMYLGSGLDAFAAWRASAGDRDRQPRLSWRIDAGSFEISWDESTRCGRRSARRAKHAEPQRPADPEDTDSVALVLLARVALAHRGYLETTSEPAFGAKVRWPQICRP